MCTKRQIPMFSSSLFLFVLLVNLCCLSTSVEYCRVIATTAVPHAPCFTEGLAVMGDKIFESCGNRVNSFIRSVNMSTGEVLKQVRLLQSYAEGLTAHDGHIFVLTWTQKLLFIFDADSLTLLGSKAFDTYNGQGWGLTTDGVHLIMSDGTDRLTFFKLPEAANFASKDALVKVKTLQVVEEGSHFPLRGINELEYVNGHIFANVLLTDTIVRIDAASGFVDALYDISALAKLSVHANTTAGTEVNPIDVVANGIAFDPRSLGTRTGPFIVTGKLWSHYYRVHLSDPQDEDGLEAPDRLWLAIMLSVLPVIVLIVFVACR